MSASIQTSFVWWTQVLRVIINFFEQTYFYRKKAQLTFTNSSFHAMASSFQPKFRHFHALLQHKSVCCTRHFHTKRNQNRLKVTVLCGSDGFVLKWRYYVVATVLWSSDSFFLNWQICAKLTDLCRTDRFVWNWQICVELTDLCGTDTLWRLKRPFRNIKRVWKCGVPEKIILPRTKYL